MDGAPLTCLAWRGANSRRPETRIEANKRLLLAPQSKGRKIRLAHPTKAVNATADWAEGWLRVCRRKIAPQALAHVGVTLSHEARQFRAYGLQTENGITDQAEEGPIIIRCRQHDKPVVGSVIFAYRVVPARARNTTRRRRWWCSTGRRRRRWRSSVTGGRRCW
jgi:hypothetical protein